MFCTQCGHRLSDDARFCPECGHKVDTVITEVKEPVATDNVVEEKKEEAAPVVEETPVMDIKGEPEFENVEEPKQIEETAKVEETKEEETKSVEETTASISGEETASENKEEKKKFDIKGYLTDENIERFSPAAALLPLFMAVVVSAISAVLYGALGTFEVGRGLCKFVVILLKIIFVLIPTAGTFGLVYIAVTKKDMSKLATWIAPFGTAVAAVSCICIAFGWTAGSWIFGIVAVVLGLEMLARIVISKQPMESEADFKSAFTAYKKYISDYKAKHDAEKAAEENENKALDKSYFDGRGIDLFGLSLLTVIVSSITCGLATPWMICKIYDWRVKHTVINGKRLTFTGTGSSLFGRWIIWALLCLVTCGIYGFFVYVDLRKWELNNTYIDGEPVNTGCYESYFNGGKIEFLGYEILSYLVVCITCGLAFPWMMAMIQKWDTKHQIIHRRRLEFTGTGLGFLGEYIIIAILCIITLGIYAPWGEVRLYKYIIKNTNFID